MPSVSPASSNNIPVEAPPPSESLPPPLSGVGECGPNGCGTIDLNAQEAICGTIPGPAGVLDDGCWICNSSKAIWEWNTDTLVACPDYWYAELGSTCSSLCEPHSPKFNGIMGGYCFVCTNRGASPGIWQKRKSTDPACHTFWNAPFSCHNSDIPYEVSCGCMGSPPVYGIYYEKTTLTEMCWLCDGTQWTNSTQMSKCNDMWLNIGGSCPPFAPDDNAYPFCGCTTEPPARGPDPLSKGQCWICHSGVWIEETDPARCTDFWVNDKCPATSDHPPLTCSTSLPTTPAGAGNCWLCTNPNEPFMLRPYDASNPLYSGYGEPCDSFWLDSEYPGYLDIPGFPDNVDTVCNNALPLTDGTKKPGIVYDKTHDQWGCWLCTSTGSYSWVYWNGDRFDHWTDSQYKACDSFWVRGAYPASIPSNPGDYERLYEYGGSGYESGSDITAIGADLFIAGYENSDESGGNTDIAVIKMNKNTGKIDWKKQYGGSKEEKAQAIITDGTDLYVAGYEVSDSKGGNFDAVVMKLSGSGSVTWKKQYGGIGDEKGFDLAYDPGTMDLYVTGSETSDIDGGNEDIFVMKLSNSGNVIWKKQYGGTKRDIGHSIVFADNSVYVAGYEMSDSSGGQSDVFVMKLDRNGSVIWKKQYGGAGTDRAYSMVVSESYIYITGYEMSDPKGGKADILVMKLDNNGNVIWKKQYGGPENDKGYAITASDNFLYVTGQEESDPQAGANYTDLPLPPGKKDLFIMKLNQSDGSVIWKQQHGGMENEMGRGITVVDGYIFTVGEESTDPDGGATDILMLSLQNHQKLTGDHRDIDDWTVNGSPLVSWASDGILINGWTVVSNSITSGTEGWTVEGDVTDWSASGADIKNWSLEGNPIDTETGSSPPHEEELLWTPIVSASTPPPPPPPPPSVEFKYQIGGAGNDYGRSIAIDPGGEFLYVAGHEDSSLIGSKTDVFILKMDIDGPDNIAGTVDDGTIIWKKIYWHYGKIGGGKAGINFDDIAKSIAVPGDGYIYITGWKQGDRPKYQNDIFVMRVFALNGGIDWARVYGGYNDDYGQSIAVDGNDLYVAGIEDGSFAGGGNRDIVIMKLSKFDGGVDWAKQYGGSDQEWEQNLETIGGEYNRDRSLVVDGDYIYYAGEEASDDNPPGTYIDIVIMKLNKINGNKVWAKQYGGDNDDKVYGATVSEGYIYVCGEEESDPPNAGADKDDIFVMKLDENDGDVVWKKQYGGLSPADIAQGIAKSGSYLYITGMENSDPAGGADDIFVMKLDENDGDVVWKNQYGGPNREKGYSIAANNSYIYITGYKSNDNDDENADVVVMKLDVDQSSNITGWPTDEDFELGLSEDIDVGYNFGEWEVMGEDITSSRSWHAGVTVFFTRDSDINKKIIDDWSVGL